MRAGLLALIGSWLALGISGMASAADPMQYPLAVAAAPDGTVYVADRDLPGVWKIANGERTVYFQGSKKFRTPLNAIRCLAIDAEGRLLAGDSATRDVFRFEDGQPKPLTNGNIGIPMALAVGTDGTIYASDLELQQLVKIPAAGGKPETVAKINAVRGLAFEQPNKLWVVSHHQPAVRRLTLGATVESETILADRPFQFSHHIALLDDGSALIADGYAKTIWQVRPGQAPITWRQGEPFRNPVGITRSGDRVFVADPHAKRVFEVTGDQPPQPFGP